MLYTVGWETCSTVHLERNAQKVAGALCSTEVQRSTLLYAAGQEPGSTANSENIRSALLNECLERIAQQSVVERYAQHSFR